MSGTVAVDIGQVLNVAIMVMLGIVGFFLRDIYRDYRELHKQVQGIVTDVAVGRERLDIIEERLGPADGRAPGSVSR